MLNGQKILITGVSGMVAMPIARYLATDNEVWGAARFADPAARERATDAGVTPVAIDLSSGDLRGLPDDFDYVLHLAYFRGGVDAFDEAIRVNAEGCGLILQHCRRVKAALVMSSNGIYSANADPRHVSAENDAIGGSVTPWAPTANAAKVAQEGVARFCARAFDLPVTIARLNTIYGPADRMMPVSQMDSIMAGREVVLRADPNPHMPIHVDDVCQQVEALLQAASVPATIVNWGGDEEVSAQQWCDMVAQWSGKPANIRYQPVAGSSVGNLADTSKRRAITGPCTVKFVDGWRRLFEQRYPEFAAH